MTKRTTSNHILLAIKQRHQKDLFWTQVKTGASGVGVGIIDAIAIRPTWVQSRQMWTGYEVKVSRSDWYNDTKYLEYLKFCHRLYIVSPPNVVQPGEIAPGTAGLMYYYPESSKLRIVLKAPQRTIDYENMASLLMYLVMWREDKDRHPFFSEKREYFEALRQDKRDKRALGQFVAGAVRERLFELEMENDDLRTKLAQIKYSKDKDERVLAVLVEAGIDPGSWGWEGKLTQRLHIGYGEDLRRISFSLKRVAKELDNLASMDRKEELPEDGENDEDGEEGEAGSIKS